MEYQTRGIVLLTIDSDVFLQVQVLDRAAEGMDVQLAFEVPDKGLGIEHVGRELCKAGGIGHSEAAGEVERTLTATMKEGPTIKASQLAAHQ